jgi:hypothetical protein
MPKDPTPSVELRRGCRCDRVPSACPYAQVIKGEQIGRHYHPTEACPLEIGWKDCHPGKGTGGGYRSTNRKVNRKAIQRLFVKE